MAQDEKPVPATVDTPYEEGAYGDGEDGRPLRKFVITNWLDSDVYTKWLGRDASIKAGDIRECGHAEAYHFMKVIVDKHIFTEADKLKDAKEKEKMEMNLLSKTYRKPFEDKTIQEINPGDESPVVRKMREDIEKKVRAEMSSNAAAGVTSAQSRGEFED